MRVTVIQADTRSLSQTWMSKGLHCGDDVERPDVMRIVNGGMTNEHAYWSTTSLINQVKAKCLGLQYEHVRVDERHTVGRYVTWSKIAILYAYLRRHPEVDMVVFLDSDAWIRDHRLFSGILTSLHQDKTKHGALSRDPKLPKNTFVNTGCMILKNTPYIHQFLQRVWAGVEEQPHLIHEWPHEQGVASRIVQNEISNFLVFGSTVLNTPCGEIVRHVWFKGPTLNELLVDEMHACMAMHVAQPAPLAEAFDVHKYLDVDARSLETQPSLTFSLAEKFDRLPDNFLRE